VGQEGLGKFKNSPHRESNQRPTQYDHSEFFLIFFRKLIFLIYIGRNVLSFQLEHCYKRVLMHSIFSLLSYMCDEWHRNRLAVLFFWVVVSLSIKPFQHGSLYVPVVRAPQGKRNKILRAASKKSNALPNCSLSSTIYPKLHSIGWWTHLGFDTRWRDFLNLPNPSCRTRPWGWLSL
jgi:hypothetical protein